MFKIFNKNKDIRILAPIDGEVIDLSQVSDPVFAEKMVGDGVAIKPKGGKIVSPIKGKVINVFPTKHAIGIESEKGVEILIHIGLDTVKLEGRGFTKLIEEGDKVEVGTPLMDVDWEYLKSQGICTDTPIVITDAKGYKLEHINVKECMTGKTEIIILK